MSDPRQTLGDVVAAYGHSLEQQIVGRGTNLACRDQELWNRVEGLLRDGITEETHCLRLDPLRVMEESLAAAAAPAAPAAGVWQVEARGGLQGLAKAFEILEQAALNLYLSPWREEYKVVKMYSGMFTHYIKPVLSVPQVEKVFGLLGYKPSSSRQEQLHLRSFRTNPVSQHDLLRFSCAFFLARCECRLLLSTLGSHVGEAEWELSLVRERQKGRGVQVALENTKKMLNVLQPAIEPLGAEVDVDLYTDEQANGGRREVVTIDDEGPRSLSWVTQGSTAPTAMKMVSNGVMSLPSPAASLPTGEQSCVSTLNWQLTKTSPGESDIPRSFSVSKRRGRGPREESTFDGGVLQAQSDMGLGRKDAGDSQSCSCLQCSYLCPTHCAECKTTHHISCAYMKHCLLEGHCLVNPESTADAATASADSEGLRASDVSAAQTHSGASAAMASVALRDDPTPMSPPLKPFAYHDCCNLAQLDPRALCLSCCVFHADPCKKREYCQVHHTVKPLGLCECGRLCTRNPLVLCRYCGREYCNACWYRNPVECTCGQTFDQSSSV